jgi:hypothetical protein
MKEYFSLSRTVKTWKLAALVELGLFGNFNFAAIRTRHEQTCPGAVKDEAELALFLKFRIIRISDLVFSVSGSKPANWLCFTFDAVSTVLCSVFMLNWLCFTAKFAETAESIAEGCAVHTKIDTVEGLGLSRKLWLLYSVLWFELALFL